MSPASRHPRTSRLRSRTPIVALAALSLVLTGCASAPATDDSGDALPSWDELVEPSEPVTIRYLTTENPNVQFGETADKFNADHENITLDIVTVPYADWDKVIQSRLETGDIDIFDISQGKGAALAARGWLADLSPVFESHIDELDKPATDQSRVDGTLYSLPLQSDTGVLFYNKTLLDQAGLPHPDDDVDADSLTYEQLKENGIAAQQAGAKWGITWDRVVSSSTYYQWSLVESAGGGSGVTGEGNLTPDVNNEAAVQALSWYGDLFAEGVTPQVTDGGTLTDVFASGQSVYHVGGSWNVATINENPDLDYGIARTPRFEDGVDAAGSGGEAIALYPGSKNKLAALVAIKALVFDEGGAIRYNSQTSSPPANDAGKEIYWQLPQFQDPRAWNLKNVVDYQIKNEIAKAGALTVAKAEWSSIVNEALVDIVTGTDARAALDTAQERLEEAFARYRE